MVAAVCDTTAAQSRPVGAPGLLPRHHALHLLREGISRQDAEWLRRATIRQLHGCRLQADDGTILFTPDGSGHYRALWTRDFAYMVRNAGDLIEPDLIRPAIEFLLRGRRADGCMPDRVTASGKPVYAPGSEDSPLADHALDNGPFMALLVCDYVRRSGDRAFFRRHETDLRRGLDFVRRADNGLVYNDPARPQCPYGFTDTVAKTGHLLFTSLLYAQACREMETACREAACGNPAEYARRAEQIRQSLAVLWDETTGMFLAADRDCRQADVWGSALAVDLELATPPQSRRIIEFLATRADRIFQRGHVRHLVAPETWQRLLTPVAAGTYQNGAYWATPHAWLLPALARGRPELAQRLLKETIAEFRAAGIHECLNGPYRNVPDYVVSATNVYAAVYGGADTTPPGAGRSR